MSSTSYPVLTPVGEDALLVEYEPEINLRVNSQVQRLAFAMQQSSVNGIREIIPAYRSLMIYFDINQLKLNDLLTMIENWERQSSEIALPPPRLFRIPTVYDKSHGPDLQHIATVTNQTPEEVVAIFSSQQYPVYCLGFLCSLAYLGGIPQQLHLPRRTTPRTLMPAGSVGIAAGQAVALPIDMPSGFHYLGQTFVTLYDPARMPPTEFQAGDFVEFPAFSAAEAKASTGRWLGECLVQSVTNR